MSYVNPPFVSEREKGTDEDCVPCSALMLALAHKPGVAPATLREAERLRQWSGYGPYGGTSVQWIAVGVERKYGFKPRLAHTFAELWGMLTRGHGAFVIIRPDRFAANHPFRIYNRGFNGFHCVYVGRKGWRRRVWMMDPEGPRNGTYQGAWVSKSDLRKAMAGDAAVLSLHRR